VLLAAWQLCEWICHAARRRPLHLRALPTRLRVHVHRMLHDVLTPVITAPSPSVQSRSSVRLPTGRIIRIQLQISPVNNTSSCDRVTGQRRFGQRFKLRSSSRCGLSFFAWPQQCACRVLCHMCTRFRLVDWPDRARRTVALICPFQTQAQCLTPLLSCGEGQCVAR
jgi:hypothetical protein